MPEPYWYYSSTAMHKFQLGKKFLIIIVKHLLSLGMAIGSTGSGARQVSDPTGVGVGAVLHPWVCPNPTRLLSGVDSDFK
jgi:hypothetical protein